MLPKHHTCCGAVKVDDGITLLRNLKNAQLRPLLQCVDDMRAELLMIQDTLEGSIQEHEMCKSGLVAKVRTLQEEYSMELRSAVDSMGDLMTALTMQNFSRTTEAVPQASIDHGFGAHEWLHRPNRNQRLPYLGDNWRLA